MRSPNLRGRWSGATTWALLKQSRHWFAMPSVPILLTRPAAASQAFAGALRAQTGRAMTIVISPLMAIRYFDLPENATKAETVVFTSRNGVQSWARSGLGTARDALCVGPATTQAARALGFDARQGGDTVDALFESIAEAPPKGGIVHVHGAHTQGDLVQRLMDIGLTADGIIGYDQPLLSLTEEALALLQGKERVIVPLFSPRSAAQFVAECPRDARTTLIAISPAVAAVAQTKIVADRPNGSAMLQAVMSRL